MPAKKSRFSILIRIDAVTNVDVVAVDWEDALVQAKNLKLRDACELTGDWIDGDGLTIESISREEQ